MRDVLVLISMLMVGWVYLAGLTSANAETEKTNLTMGGKGISGPLFQLPAPLQNRSTISAAPMACASRSNTDTNPCLF